MHSRGLRVVQVATFRSLLIRTKFEQKYSNWL